MELEQIELENRIAVQILVNFMLGYVWKTGRNQRSLSWV